MRLYTFTNFYLSQIQQGIQPLHVLGEMIHLYDNPSSNEYKHLQDWAKNHKTVICLNGGNTEMMNQTWLDVSRLGHRLRVPTARFFEDQASLSGAFTSFGIILPELVYASAADIREKGADSLAHQHLPAGYVELIEILNRHRLA